MARHAARRAAMQLVYELLLGGSGEGTLVDMIEYPQDDPDAPYAEALVSSVRARLPQLEQAVTARSENRALERIPAVVRSILYVAMVELDDQPDVPDSVVINEAVQLAHQYAEEADARFVNGVLGNHLRGTKAK